MLELWFNLGFNLGGSIHSPSCSSPYHYLNLISKLTIAILQNSCKNTTPTPTILNGSPSTLPTMRRSSLTPTTTEEETEYAFVTERSQNDAVVSPDPNQFEALAVGIDLKPSRQALAVVVDVEELRESVPVLDVAQLAPRRLQWVVQGFEPPSWSSRGSEASGLEWGPGVVGVAEALNEMMPLTPSFANKGSGGACRARRPQIRNLRRALSGLLRSSIKTSRPPLSSSQGSIR